MNNKKGFTLIELIVTIMLMATLSISVGLNVSNLADRQKVKEQSAYKRRIENAACVYAEQMGLVQSTCNSSPASCRISVSDLINRGLVNKELKNPLTNKTAKEDSTIIQITWANNERKCTYS